MPIVNGIYKNPGWTNGEGTPINAQNLNDICNTLEKLDAGRGGGVTSFKGRVGTVVPQSGDYTADQVGARPNTWIPTAAQVGAVPISRTVNGKPLSSNITITAADVGAAPITYGTSDLTAGSSSLTTGSVYLVYE